MMYNMKNWYSFSELLKITFNTYSIIKLVFLKINFK